MFLIRAQIHDILVAFLLLYQRASGAIQINDVRLLLKKSKALYIYCQKYFPYNLCLIRILAWEYLTSFAIDVLPDSLFFAGSC